MLAAVSDIALLGVCVYALLRGGRPERRGAFITLTAWSTTIVVRLLVTSAWVPGHLAILVIDLTVTAGFWWLAMATPRFWPVWAFGFALGDIFTSLAGTLLPNVPLLAYHSGLGIYADLALASLAIGTWRSRAQPEPITISELRSPSSRVRSPGTGQKP